MKKDMKIENNTNEMKKAKEGKKITIGLIAVMTVFAVGIGIGSGILISDEKIMSKDETKNVVAMHSTAAEKVIEAESDKTRIDMSKIEDAKKEVKETKETEKTKVLEDQSFAGLVQFKQKSFENTDYNASTHNIKEYCELTFDNIGTPGIRIGAKSAETTECDFYTRGESYRNYKAECAAGTTYVTFDFDAWTPGGDTTGRAVLSYSNVEDSNEITVNVTIKMDGKDVEYKNIVVKPIESKASNIKAEGKYVRTEKTDNTYYEATIEIKNQTDSSIEFEMSAVHGSDEEHVNMGQLYGTAKRVEENEYLYEENVDGNICKIIFKFDEHRIFKYVYVTESYSNNVNPYAGYGVYFSGDYEFMGE